MESRSRFFSLWLLPCVLAGSLIATSCTRHDERVYDSEHGDYHAWNHDEVSHYNQWATENHRDANRDFRALSPEEQREYWNWRHRH